MPELAVGPMYLQSLEKHAQCGGDCSLFLYSIPNHGRFAGDEAQFRFGHSQSVATPQPGPLMELRHPLVDGFAGGGHQGAGRLGRPRADLDPGVPLG